MMSGTGDDGKRSFRSSEEECKARTRKRKTVRGTVMMPRKENTLKATSTQILI